MGWKTENEKFKQLQNNTTEEDKAQMKVNIKQGKSKCDRKGMEFHAAVL